MSALGSIIERAVLNHLLAVADIGAVPSNLYLGLFDSPGATDFEQEPAILTSELSAGANYARQQIIPFHATGATTDGSYVTTISNDTAITFPQAGDNWGTASHIAILSTLSGAGTVYFWGALTAAKTIQTNDQFTFAAGALVLQLD